MKLFKYCTGEELKKSRLILMIIAAGFFMYFAGEAVGEFLYHITH